MHGMPFIEKTIQTFYICIVQSSLTETVDYSRQRKIFSYMIFAVENVCWYTAALSD